MSKAVAVNLVPLGANVLVKMDQQPGITAGGIHIPDVAKRKTQTGTVVAVGPGDDKNPVSPNLVVGARVCYKAWVGCELEADEFKGLILLEFRDVLGVVDHEPVDGDD